MKNKLLIKSIICFLLILLISAKIPSAGIMAKSNYAADDLEKVIDGIISYKQKEAKVSSVQELIDTELAKKAGTGPAEWYILALNRYKESCDYSTYLEALDSYAENMESAKATDLQRMALAYSFCGANDKFIEDTMKDTIGSLGIMSYIYGLILMDSRAYVSEKISREDIIDELLSRRLEDGGWALTGKVSDIDITAMAVQALAPYYKENEVKIAVDDALGLLSKRQLDTGDYKSWGVRSCESVAQVITALCALDIDFQTDKRFIKDDNTLIDGLMHYVLTDGSFGHTIDGLSNDTATVQAMHSLIAAWRQSKGLDSFYTMTDSIEAVDPPQDTSQEAERPDSELIEDGVANETGTTKVPVLGMWTFKLILSASIIGMIIIGLILLYLRKRLSKKNASLLIMVMAIILIGVWFIRFESVTDYYNVNNETIEPGSETVFISIRCDTVAGLQSSLEIPADGVILESTEYSIKEGDSVFDILLRAVKQNKIQLDYQGADKNLLGTVYVKGINHLYEYEFGELSGWMYRVNGEFSGKGCNDYPVSDKDVIEWVYTRDLGKDVGEE